MKKFTISLLLLLVIATNGSLNAQVIETNTESRTRTTQDGKAMFVETETTTNVGGVYTRSFTETHSEVAFGIKADANLFGFLQNSKEISNDMKFGGSFGGFMKIVFSKGFVMQPELNIHYKTSTMTDIVSGTKQDYQYWGIEIPFYYMGQFKLGKGNGYAGLAPYFGIGLSAKYKTNEGNDINLYKKDTTIEKSQMKRCDFGFAAQVGYEFRCGIQINAAYKIGVINASKVDGFSMYPQTVSLGLGYKF